MAEWIEIPRQRVYVVTNYELATLFDCYGENGELLTEDLTRHLTLGEFYQAVRKKDGMVFIPAPGPSLGSLVFGTRESGHTVLREL